MKLVRNWRKAWKMASFQMAVVLIFLEWGNNFFGEMPHDAAGWAQGIAVLLLPIARLLHQEGIDDG